MMCIFWLSILFPINAIIIAKTTYDHHTPSLINKNNANKNHEYTTIYSSCNDIAEDGLFYIKPMPDLPVLPVICSNGYAMLDASLDIHLKTFPFFLSSWDYGRINTDYILSRLDDTSTFREWFIPSDEHTKFHIAPNCLQCIPGDFGDDTVYYIDSHTYCFSAATINGCIDDKLSVNYHIESCNTCDVGVFADSLESQTQNWIKCMAVHMPSDYEINHDHISCVAHGLTFHPSLSTTRDSCTCYQPLEENGVMQYQIAWNELPLVTSTPHEFTRYGLAVADNIQFDLSFSKAADNDVADQRDSNIVYLYNRDFMSGTLRIKESGTYIVMEHIVFNFNAPSDAEMEKETFSPNSIDVEDLYWYPTHAQTDENSGEYKGLYSFSGAFTLGFFAGIAIETDYVTLDLNGYTLSMDYKFYFQQRFFSLIELASQPFVPGQGPANWGAGNAIYASHVIIKNGNLGLSSHHGIHGNNNNFVTITNVNSFDFDVAGIQCNACTNVLLEDAVIGPQNNNIPLLGRYTHCRAYLPRLQQLMLHDGEDEITFYNRETTSISALIGRLINQMDMMYFHFINGEEYAADDSEWVAAQKLFLNPSGWMDGGSSYGVLFGGSGAQVVGIGARIDGTSDITIRNVEISGIYNSLIEKVKFTASFGATRLIFFDAMDWMAASDQVNDIATSNYIGDAYSDLTFAISKVVDSWYFMNSLYVSPEMEAHVFEGEHEGFISIFKQPNPATDKGQHVIGGCGTDIQLHSSKGAIGLRIDGTQNLNVDNLHVHDIYNWAELGNEEWCGEYPGPTVGNEDIDIQYGYTGTRAHGVVMDFVEGVLKNVEISGIESYHGEANGMTVYKQCNVELENINVDDITAGSHLTKEGIDKLNSPNLIPRACGVDIRPDTVVRIKNVGIVKGENIVGYETCYDIEQNQPEKNKSFESIILILSASSIILYVVGIIMNQFCTNHYKKIQNLSELTPLLFE